MILEFKGGGGGARKSHRDRRQDVRGAVPYRHGDGGRVRRVPGRALIYFNILRFSESVCKISVSPDDKESFMFRAAGPLQGFSTCFVFALNSLPIARFIRACVSCPSLRG